MEPFLRRLLSNVCFRQQKKGDQHHIFLDCLYLQLIRIPLSTRKDVKFVPLLISQKLSFVFNYIIFSSCNFIRSRSRAFFTIVNVRTASNASCSSFVEKAFAPICPNRFTYFAYVGSSKIGACPAASCTISGAGVYSMFSTLRISVAIGSNPCP